MSFLEENVTINRQPFAHLICSARATDTALASVIALHLFLFFFIPSMEF
jgi:hypothetical protein